MRTKGRLSKRLAFGIIEKITLFDLAIIGLILLSIFNAIDCYGDGSPFLDYVWSAFPYAILSVIALICKKKNAFIFIWLLCLLTSHLMFWFKSSNEYSGMAFLLFAVYIIRKPVIRIAIISIQYISIILLNTILDNDLNSLLTMLFIYSFAFAIYFILEKQEADKKPELIAAELDDDEKEILSLLVQGKHNKEIAYEMSLSVSAISHKIDRVRKKLGVLNNEQMVYNLTRKGYFRQKLQNCQIAGNDVV